MPHPNRFSISTTVAAFAFAWLGLVPCAAQAAELPRLLKDYTVTERDTMTPGAPYVVQGSLTVGRPGLLTIQPGTVVRFDPGAILRVDGMLRVESSAKDIVLQSNAATPAAGSWAGIEISGTSPRVLLDGVTIEDAITAVKITGGDASQSYTITHSTLRNFSVSAIVSGRFVPGLPGGGSLRTGTIRDNRIEGRGRTGDGIAFFGSGTAPIQIAANRISGLDRGIVQFNTSSTVTGNTIEQNNLGVMIDRGSPRILDGNQIVDNGTGIMRSGGDDAQPIVNGNAIFGNTNMDYVSTGPAATGDPFAPGVFQNAENNYWGTDDATAIAAKVSVGAGALGRRPVDFVPFLDSEGGRPVAADGLLLGVLRPAQGEDVIAIPADSDVTLLASALVPADVVLEIGAGSRVLAMPGQGLAVAGTLRILGRRDALVSLTPPTGTTWLGIDLQPGSTDSRIECAVIENVRVSPSARGVIDVHGSQLALSDTLIRTFQAPAAVAYRDGATGSIQRIGIDNRLRSSSRGIGIQLENASPSVTDSSILNTATGIGLYRRNTSLLVGNTVMSNNIGIYLEGAQTTGADPAPRINRNNLTMNAAVNRIPQSIVLDKFGPVQAAPIDARQNFFNLPAEGPIRATIVNRGTNAVEVDVSGFLTQPVPPPVP